MLPGREKAAPRYQRETSHHIGVVGRGDEKGPFRLERHREAQFSTPRRRRQALFLGKKFMKKKDDDQRNPCCPGVLSDVAITKYDV